jgi:hypothetical protein
VPVKSNGTLFVTTNPYIILTPDMNPVYPDSVVNFTATPVGFTASNYEFILNGGVYQSGASNQFSYYITTLMGNYEANFAVNATDASGAYPDGVYNYTDEYVVLPPSISINTSQASVDPGRQVEFNSSFTTNLHPCGRAGYEGSFPLPNYSYNWFVNGNEEYSTGSDMNYTFDSEGNYTIGVELSNSTGPLVHHFFQNYTYRVDPPLKAVVSSSDNPADIGQSITFRLIPSGSTGEYTSYSYRLYNTDSNLSSVLYSGTTPSFSAILDSAGTYLISYEVESSNGFYQNATLSQFVNSDPAVSIYANKTTTDVGNPISFLLSTIGGTPPYSYSWFYSSSSTPSSYVQFATGNSTIFKFSREGTYYIFVRLTDAAGFNVNSTSLVVTVNPSFSVYISSSIGAKALWANVVL